MLMLALVAAAGLPMPAAGQVVDVEAVTPDPSARPFVFQAGYDHVLRTDLDGPGSMSLDSFQAGIGGRFELTDALSLNTRFLYALDAYDISDSAVPLDWESIHQYTLVGLLDWKLDEQWSLLGGPLLRLAGEGWSAFDDGFTGGALVGFNYRPSTDLSLGLAIGVVSQIEDDPGIVPIPMVRWHFAEPFTLSAGVSALGGRIGVGPELTWHAAEELDLGFGAQYQRRRFRLDDHGLNEEGVGEDTSLPIYARLTWRPVEAASVELFAGVVAGGELRVEDSGGHQGYDRDYDATPSLGLRGQFRF
jgi:hypothetical protein